MLSNIYSLPGNMLSWREQATTSLNPNFLSFQSLGTSLWAEWLREQHTSSLPCVPAAQGSF